MARSESALNVSMQLVRTELERVFDDLEPALVAQAVDVFQEPERRWFFSGQGRSGLSAKMAAMRFMHLGRRAHVLGEVTAPSVRADDGIVLFSGSGSTAVTTHFARIAKSQDAYVVAVTHQPNSELAHLADSTITIPAAESRQLGGSLFEQMAMVFFDAVVLELASTMPDARGEMSKLHTNMQ